MDATERQRRVAAEAADWWLILQGDASRSQREQYVDWLRESPLHVAEMLRVAHVHGALERFQRWDTISIDGPRQDTENLVRFPKAPLKKDSRGSSSEARLWRPMALAAAAVLLIVTALAALQVRRNDSIIRTVRGERREVALADGSIVQIDPETRLRVQYEKSVRRVILERGRALFHVAKNAERPFLVQASETTVRAIGTAFAIEKSDDESLLVTVAEGTVAVSAAPPGASASHLNNAQGMNQPSASPSTAGNGTQLFVTAGQQVSVARAGGPEAVHSVDSTRALAWAEGRLIFDDSSVADAVLQFNRYNRIQIIVNDQALAHRLINGTFNASDPNSFAAFIQSVAPVRVSRDDRDDITVDALK